MNEDFRQRCARLWRAEFCSPGDFVRRAVVIALLFLAAHMPACAITRHFSAAPFLHRTPAGNSPSFSGCFISSFISRSSCSRRFFVHR